jgi:hypothetical protein
MGSCRQNSAALIVFGFAFNPYDEEFLDHLTIYGKNLKSVVLVNKTENAAHAARIWPAASIKCVLPPPDGYAELRSWIKDNAVAS